MSMPKGSAHASGSTDSKLGRYGDPWIASPLAIAAFDADIDHDPEVPLLHLKVEVRPDAPVDGDVVTLVRVPIRGQGQVSPRALLGARRAGVRQPSLSAIENGPAKRVDVAMLEQIAAALEVDLPDLLTKRKRGR
jgi:hypothetical protein